MKIKLILARTACDNVSSAWTEIKTVEVEIPLNKQHEQRNSAFPWQVIGAEWPEESEGLNRNELLQ